MKRCMNLKQFLFFSILMIAMFAFVKQTYASSYITNIRIYTKGTKKEHAVELKWKSAPGASFYRIERSEYRKGGWTEFVVMKKSVKKTTYKDKKAKAGSRYRYRISACKKDKEKPLGMVNVAVKKPRVLMLDCSGRKDIKRVKRYLSRAGFSVNLVTDKVYVNKRRDVKISSYDALVIPGGYSVNPEFYHDKVRNGHSNFGKKMNDRIQIDAVKKFTAAKKPVLGLCRGCQVVNVALGGTIKQCLGKPHTHMGKMRKVRIKKDSWLYGRFGSSLNTLHSHHQNVARLGEDLQATQWDKKDGNVEGFEHKYLPVYGLQWHPDSWKSKSSKRTGAQVFVEFRSLCQQWMR